MFKSKIYHHHMFHIFFSLCVFVKAQFEDEQRMGRPNYYESSSEQDSRDIHERSDGELTEEEQRPRRGCTTRSQWNRTNNKRKIVRDSSTESESY